MNRREFEKVLALGAAATALPGGLARAGQGPRADVVLAGLAKGSPEDALIKAVKTAAQAATDFSWLSRGDSVIIKPVLNSGNGYPATTSPLGIKAMVELLKGKGAGRVILMDMSGVEHVKLEQKRLRGSSRELMNQCGMARAGEAAGAELYFPEEAGWGAFFEESPESGSSWKGPIMMPRIIKEVDHVVLMPRTGRHVLAGSSLGLKAAVGWWRYDTRLEYHRDASTFQEKTAEANTVPSLLSKQRLVLTTATKVLTTFGPDDGHVVEPDTGLVIASTSIVAHDMVSLAWLIENREATPGAEKTAAKDPNSSQAMVSAANRGVVMLLGGVMEAARAEKLAASDVSSIGDDRVITHACRVFGGTPRIELRAPDESVPPSILTKMKSRVAT
ncbi:MAG TPA: DUF362 domain-containing protein [bacterium]|nr:DUF362 domain-containing protein [bacterium]